MFEDLIRKNEKAMTVRLSRDLWLFLKDDAARKETHLNKIINKVLNSYRKKVEKNSEKSVDTEF